MCIYFGVCVSVCACRCAHLCVHMWKPKVDSEYLASLLFILFFQDILLNLEFAILARLAAYKPLVAAYCLSTGVKGICHLTLTWVLEMQSQSQALMLI